MPLLGAGDDDRGATGRAGGLRQRLVDLGNVMAVDLDRLPAEATRPVGVGVQVPAVHRLAGLAEPIDVDDGRQVVQLPEAGGLERLPHRALGHLRVAAQAPDVVGQPVEVLSGVRDADRDRQALAQRAGGHVHPGQDWRRMPLDPAPQLAEGEHLLVTDGAGRLEHRVQQRRGVALREDQVVIARVRRLAEVVVQVAAHQDRHQVSGGHRRGRMTGGCRGAGADRVDPQLLAELAPLLLLVHVGVHFRKFPAVERLCEALLK